MVVRWGLCRRHNALPNSRIPQRNTSIEFNTSTNVNISPDGNSNMQMGISVLMAILTCRF